jgi:hypothetical protein
MDTNTNPMLENFLADAPAGLADTAREYLAEIAGQFANDPVADFGQAAVDQVRQLCEHILADEGN